MSHLNLSLTMKHVIHKSSFIKVGIFLYARYAAPGITTRARNSIRHHSLAPRNIYIPPRRSTHTRLVSESEVNILVSEKNSKTSSSLLHLWPGGSLQHQISVSQGKFFQALGYNTLYNLFQTKGK